MSITDGAFKIQPPTHGWGVTCPLCQTSIARSFTGIRAHLNKHVREGKLSSDKLRESVELLLKQRGIRATTKEAQR